MEIKYNVNKTKITSPNKGYTLRRLFGGSGSAKRQSGFISVKSDGRNYYSVPILSVRRMLNKAEDAFAKFLNADVNRSHGLTLKFGVGFKKELRQFAESLTEQKHKKSTER